TEAKPRQSPIVILAQIALLGIGQDGHCGLETDPIIVQIESRTVRRRRDRYMHIRVVQHQARPLVRKTNAARRTVAGDYRIQVQPEEWIRITQHHEGDSLSIWGLRNVKIAVAHMP